MAKFQFDWCLELPPHLHRPDDIDVALIPANRFAVVRCQGDPHKENRAWRHLFHAWLPRSGYQPTHDPAMEVYRRNPLDTGCSVFDMDCYLPVKALRTR